MWKAFSDFAFSLNAGFELCFHEFAFLPTTEAGRVGNLAAGTEGKVLEPFALLVAGSVTESRREEGLTAHFGKPAWTETVVARATMMAVSVNFIFKYCLL